MRWFCKKEQPKVEEKKPLTRTKELVFKKASFNVGRTQVLLTLADKRKFKTFVYGWVYQNYNKGRDQDNYYYMLEPACDPPTVCDSLSEARMFIKRDRDVPGTFADDHKNAKKSIFGQVIAAEILQTESYSEEFDVASVVRMLPGC